MDVFTLISVNSKTFVFANKDVEIVITSDHLSINQKSIGKIRSPKNEEIKNCVATVRQAVVKSSLIHYYTCSY